MTNPAWPQDADGDVLRRLEASDFNFSEPCSIDFNIDFSTWPPSSDFIFLLRQQFSGVQVFEPDHDGSGYVQFVVNAKLTYALVRFVQSAVTEMAAPYGGVCESWGVLH